MQSRGFSPIARLDARILVLGSLPGQMSLQRGEYYAQPQNAFWKIAGRLFDAAPELPYGERVNRLLTQRIAVWDVCASAFRPGSLDSAIQRRSIVTNDFADFFARHPEINLIAFNGAKAAELYVRMVRDQLPESAQNLRSIILPSTSPAHASLSFQQKLRRWSVLRRKAVNETA